MASDEILDGIVDLSEWIEGRRPGREPATEFLGDLYQMYCEVAREDRALVQTPDFVREFILGETLGVYLDRNGPGTATMIDPACGCGHFLADGFRLIWSHWAALDDDETRACLVEAGRPDLDDPSPADLAQVVLDQVFGVDLDPVCVAIARMRLLFEAWAVVPGRPNLRLNVFVGDSLLLHRPRPDDPTEFGFDPHFRQAMRVLEPGQYAAVVANPPYITCKDARRSAAYRERYESCHGKYSLGLPFTEMCFALARPGLGSPTIADPAVAIAAKPRPAKPRTPSDAPAPAASIPRVDTANEPVRKPTRAAATLFALEDA